MNYELGIMKQETIGCCGLVAWRRASPALQFTDMWRSETPEFHSAPAAVDPDTKGCAPRQPARPGGDESQVLHLRGEKLRQPDNTQQFQDAGCHVLEFQNAKALINCRCLQADQRPQAGTVD